MLAGRNGVIMWNIYVHHSRGTLRTARARAHTHTTTVGVVFCKLCLCSSTFKITTSLIFKKAVSLQGNRFYEEPEAV
jgi:hypothetical protein